LVVEGSVCVPVEFDHGGVAAVSEAFVVGGVQLAVHAFLLVVHLGSDAELFDLLVVQRHLLNLFQRFLEEVAFLSSLDQSDEGLLGRLQHV